MKKPFYTFLSYGSNPRSATISIDGKQETWYYGTAVEEFTCLLTGLKYFEGGPCWLHPERQEIISGEGMHKLTYGRLKQDK